MYGYVTGYSETREIAHCSRCGTEIGIGHGDGSVSCQRCGYRFFVIEHEDSKSFYMFGGEDEKQ